MVYREKSMIYIERNKWYEHMDKVQERGSKGERYWKKIGKKKWEMQEENEGKTEQNKIKLWNIIKER